MIGPYQFQILPEPKVAHCINCGGPDPNRWAHETFLVPPDMDAGTPIYNTLSRELNYDPIQHPDQGPKNRAEKRRHPLPRKKSRRERKGKR